MKKLFILLISITAVLAAHAQETKYKVKTVAYYNLENLFDTIDSPDTKDTEFTPEGEKNYDSEKYNKKLKNLSYVIEKIGSDFTKQPPVICGISEIENATVVKDLIKKTRLKNYNYDFVHHDGPDERGVDVGLLYRKDFFEVSDVKNYRVSFDFDKDDKTRDQMLVSGSLNGEKMHFIVIHYPSRRGGEKESRPKRIAAAKVSRHIIDSLQELNPESKIIIMGDFNDNPDNKSVRKHLNAKSSKKNLDDNELFNPMADLHKKGIGSGAYRDKWYLFDMLILSKPLIDAKEGTHRFYQAHIFNKPELTQREGRFKGYPYRTFVGNKFMGGYSDHFPAYIYLIRAVD